MYVFFVVVVVVVVVVTNVDVICVCFNQVVSRTHVLCITVPSAHLYRSKF